MALLFAVNGHVHVDDAVVPLGKPRHGDGRAVRHLLVQRQKQLFPHDLRADLLFRLVGYHILREQLRPVRRVFAQRPEQLLHAVARLRRDGNDLVKGKRLAVRRDHAEQRALVLHRVDLVDDQHDRHAGAAELVDQRRLLRPDGGDRLDEQHHRVHIRDAVRDDLVHVIAELRARAVKAGRVDEHELRVVPARHGQDAAARCLRLRRNDGDLLADERVRERGFADVRPAGYGYHRSFLNHFSSFSIMIFSRARISFFIGPSSTWS